jgi:long-chain acyl-CoA synthetase
LTKPYYEKREITDFKDLINQSVSIYGNKNAFSVKGIMGEYTGIKYRDFKRDIDALGTEFINMGLRHEKIAVIGENRYEWCVTYLATTCGTGTIVPLDKELPVQELRYLIETSKAKAIVFSGKLKNKVAELVHTLSERLGIQIVEVTHVEELMENSDKRFIIKKIKGVSNAEN